MRPQRFKVGNKVKVVYLYMPDFTVTDQEKWDKLYRDKVGVIESLEGPSDSLDCYMYQVQFPMRTEVPLIAPNEEMYDIELEFADE